MKEMLQHRSAKEIEIAEAVFDNYRLSPEQALYLYENSDPVFCGYLANIVKERKYDKRVFYNKNIHVEVSNICINRCRFCSFYRDRSDRSAWEMNIDDVMVLIAEKSTDRITEIHITGGLHPEKKLAFYVELLTRIRAKYLEVHIKAFTAVEIDYFAKTENRSYQDVLGILKSCGMNSLAGGGAEILDDEIRGIICPLKTKSQRWIEIHRIAHEMGIKTNCTILYGHIEKYKDRVSHMKKLRELQDKTGGFICFIPLKYKSYGNSLEINNEISLSEELKNYAISRLFLDNIPHLKAYWPMCGVEIALMALSFGADDFDGTISDSTKIYSMAGGEKNPELNENQIINLLSQAGFKAIERNSEYVVIGGE